MGLCGDDGWLLRARPLRKMGADGKVLDLGLVGEVAEVNVELLSLLGAYYVPVVASVGVGPDGESYNINADTVAAALAGALKAEKVIFLTDVPGILAEPGDESSVVSECTASEVRQLVSRGKISKGMLPKVEAVLSTLEAGVRSAHIIDGRIPHSVLLEILTDDAGVGTKIVPDAPSSTKD